MPQKALANDFLLYGILAFTSLHIASEDSDPATALSYVDTALQYYNMTFAPFRNALDNLTPANCDAVFANSVLVAAIGLALPRLSVGRRDDDHDDDSNSNGCVIETVAVASDLVEGVTRLHTIGRTWFSSHFITDYFSLSYRLDHGILDSSTRDALSQLALLNATTVPDADQRAINGKALSVLEYCFSRLVDSSHHKEDTMSWLILVDKEFSACLKRREPFSLLILMHWAVLVHRLDGDVWWMRNAGRDLVSELTKELAHSDPRWDVAKIWPLQKVMGAGS